MTFALYYYKICTKIFQAQFFFSLVETLKWKEDASSYAAELVVK